MYYKRWTAEINPKGLYYVRKTYIMESEKRWVTIDGRHVDIGGDGDSGSGGGAVCYAGLKDKFSAIKDKIRNKTTPEKYKEVSDEYLESLPKLTEPESIEQSLAGTNPHGYTTNCQRCVPVYEMRRRGYDVAAADAPKNPFDDSIGFYNYKNVFVDMQWKKCSGTGYEEIKDYLLKNGNGTTVEISIRTISSGHLFVAHNQNGQVIFVDPQYGKSDATDRFFKAINGYTEYARIDCLKLSNMIKECIGA